MMFHHIIQGNLIGRSWPLDLQAPFTNQRRLIILDIHTLELLPKHQETHIKTATAVPKSLLATRAYTFRGSNIVFRILVRITIHQQHKL